jgi:hypothetical protein
LSVTTDTLIFIDGRISCLLLDRSASAGRTLKQASTSTHPPKLTLQTAVLPVKTAVASSRLGYLPTLHRHERQGVTL